MRGMKAEEVFTGERFVPGIEDEQLEMEHYQRYYSVLPLVKDKVVLDAACGEGYGTNILAKAAKRVTGMDISADAVERARSIYGGREQIEFVEASVTQLPFADDSLDVVVSFETIEHIAEELQQEFLKEIARVLKTNGMLIMSTPNKKVYSDLHNYQNEYHVKEFYKEEFVEFLTARFQYVQLYNQYFEVCSVIDREGEHATEAYYYKPAEYKEDGKFFIAVATHTKQQLADLSHIMMNRSPEYLRKIERILTLQEEVEARNQHLHKLDQEIEEYRNVIKRLQSERDLLADMKQEIADKEKEIEKCRALIRELKIQVGYLEQLSGEFREQNQVLRQSNEEVGLYNQWLRQEMQKASEEVAEAQSKINNLRLIEEQERGRVIQLEQQISILNQTVLNKEGHIELLLEVEREYEREKHSRTYRMAMQFRKISLWFLPLKSKRRFFARLLARAARDPKLMLKMINPRRIRNCFTILKTEGVESAVNHLVLVEEYEKSRTVPLISNLDLVQPEEQEKKKEDYKNIVFPHWDKPQVSIIIPVYNQFDYTYHCLESILKNSGNCTYEVIIANDCSTDLTTEMEDIVDGITVITNETNLRFLLNCNHAAQYAKGQYILFLNNDTQVQENWLEPLVSLMERDETVGMTGSKLIYADGYLQEAGGILWEDASAWNYGNRQNPNDSEFSYVHEVDYISGAAMMIRKELWEQIGGFDVRFAPAYCEDSDLAFEVRRHGFKVMLQPKSVVVHFEGISNGTDVTAGQKKYQVDNQKKFYEKWKEELRQNHFENGSEVFLARDRGRGKKHILVIDHYVPQYDRDAGSKTTWMYLKMLVAKGYHITFLGDNFYQHEPYTTELQQMGVLVLYGPKYAENWKDWLMENMSYFDIFYLNRPHISIKYIDLIKEHARGKIIYYGHDLHFMRTHREYELSGDVKLLDESHRWRDQEMYIMKRADMNYYPSCLESDEIHRLDPSIPVKAITAYAFENFREEPYQAAQREGLLFVGGFGHGPNLDAVLWFLDKIFPEVYRRVGAPFYIVGSKAPEEITQIKMDGVIVKGFVSEEELQELYNSCRMAVVPLRYGAGVKGKVVEALYYGLPVVTTSVGAEGIGDIGRAAVIKDQEAELIQAICELYTDYEQLTNMAEESQKLVKAHFSIEAVWNVIKDDFM